MWSCDWNALPRGKRVSARTSFGPSPVVYYPMLQAHFPSPSLAFIASILLFHQRRELVVLSDPALLLQYLTNLLSNAAKFTDRGHVLITCQATPHPTVAG